MTKSSSHPGLRPFQGMLQGNPAFVNVGVAEFAESLLREGFEVVTLRWSPPAGGDREMAELLDKLL